MTYIQKYNKDDIHIRSVIIGLINLLNQEIFYVNVHSNEQQDIVECPFYYSTTGDERFLQDYFMEWRDCIHPKYITGNFDPIPRGIVKLTDMNINTGNLTQRWIRGEFTRLIDGKLETFSAYINSLPLDFSFNVSIRADTITDIFKITQAVLETFYHIQIYNTSYKGVMIPCQVGFPDAYPIEKTFEFTYPTDTNIEMNFQLTLETYLPVFDEPNLGSLMAINDANSSDKLKNWLNNTPEGGIKLIDTAEKPSIGNLMGNSETTYYVGESRRNKIQVRAGDKTKNINDNLSAVGTSLRKTSNRMDSIIVGDFTVQYDNTVDELTLITPKIGDEYISTGTMEISWVYTGFIHKLDIYYSINYGNTWEIIERFVPAAIGKFDWIIPNITSIQKILVICEKGYGAEIMALVDINGEIYDTMILNAGNDYDQTVVLELESENGSGAELLPSVINGKINDVLIRQPGLGYDISKQHELTIKIVSSDGNVVDYLKDINKNIGVVLVK